MTLIIYATVKPIEEYNVTLESGNVFGLHSSYMHKPSLLALIMIGTHLAYDYEGSKPDKERQVEITNLEPLKLTLEEEIGGKTVEVMLKTLNPIEFYEALESQDLTQLPVTQQYYKGNGEIFKKIVGARAGAWGVNRKGKIKTIKNVIQVSFGTSSHAVPEKLVILHEAFSRRLNNA